MLFCFEEYWDKINEKTAGGGGVQRGVYKMKAILSL